MDYRKIYEQLVQKRKSNPLSDSEYGEIHHIVPRSIGGSDEEVNLIKLTPEEHLLAHLLLVKIYPSSRKLLYAANWMTSRVKNNKEYGWIKREFSRIEKIAKTGVPRSTESIEKQRNTIRQNYNDGYVNPGKGRTLTEEHKKAISQGNKGKTVPIRSRSNLEGYILRYGDTEGPIRYQIDNEKKNANSLPALIKKFGEEEGRKIYETRRERLSNQMRGENNHFFGKTHTLETKALIAANTSKAQKGRPKPKKVCSNCGNLYAVNTLPHHLKKCIKS